MEIVRNSMLIRKSMVPRRDAATKPWRALFNTKVQNRYLSVIKKGTLFGFHGWKYLGSIVLITIDGI